MKLRKLLVLLLVFVAAFVLSACGEAGIAGLTGAKGPQGETGAQGEKGAVGDVGEQGAQGETGANGVGIEFSFTSKGLAWRQVGSEEWNIGLEYKEIFKKAFNEKVVVAQYTGAAYNCWEGAEGNWYYCDTTYTEMSFKFGNKIIVDANDKVTVLASGEDKPAEYKWCIVNLIGSDYQAFDANIVNGCTCIVDPDAGTITFYEAD